MAEQRIEVTRPIRADRHRIFEVLRDPKGQVAIDASGSLMSSDDEPVAGVGDTFVVHMDREAIHDVDLGLYDVTVEITSFVPDAEIAWTISAFDNRRIGHIYGYRLEDAEGGTLVTSYCDWSAIPEEYKASGVFPVIPESALRATLGILARTVQD
jgi:hypothetical protein